MQTNITSYIDCIWAVFDTIYAAGGRRFVLLNTAPLQLAPLYAPQSVGGVGDSKLGPAAALRTSSPLSDPEGKTKDQT